MNSNVPVVGSQDAVRLQARTLCEVLGLRAALEPERLAFRFLPDGEGQGTPITYAELDRRARVIAQRLGSYGCGARAMLLYPPGLDFIAAFFGCLYAGVIAVPAYPPRRNRSADRLRRIALDCRPSVALTDRHTAAVAGPLFQTVEELAKLPLIETDALTSNRAPELPKVATPEALAFLQYTSGSTGSPKGVMVSHGNLMHNLATMHEGLQLTRDDIGAGWLPMHHDMGLIGQMMYPLYLGFPATFMPPAAFLKRPLRWLKTISDCRVTASVAPNFALDFCVRDIRAEDRAGLDLSSWRLLLCGAEPVRAETIERFADVFAPCGFRREAIRPGYGLAEGTLLATVGDGAQGPRPFNIDGVALDSNRLVLSDRAEHVRTVIGNGRAWNGQEIAIVNPDTRQRCASGAVGEVWIKGGSVAQGYWEKPEITAEVFQARLADGEAGNWLRTGDLGVMHDGELLVTGRAKDVVILRGRNHYPQDIEWTVDDCATRLGDESPFTPGAAAAFAVETGGEERLVIVVEGTRALLRAAGPHGAGTAEAGRAIGELRAAIAHEHEVELHDVAIIRPGTLPRTSSGKVQRFRARELYRENGLELIASLRPSREASVETKPAEAEAAPAATPLRDPAVVQEWLTARCAAMLGVSPETLPANADLAYFGMSSVTAMRLVGELEDWLKISLPQNLMWEHPTIEQIARFVADFKAPTDTLATALALAPDNAARFDPFPLNEIQQAYWFGRSDAFALGGVACQFYNEFEVDGLDLERLASAWRKVIERHDMLRAVIGQDGNQRVLAKVPAYEIEVEDLRTLAPLDQKLRHDALREKLSHVVRDTTRWPLFDIRAQRLSDTRVRIHLGFDLLVADVWSLYLVLGEWELFYRDPSYAPAPLSLHFRDYLAAVSREQTGDTARRARDYWLDRVKSLPESPKLPLAHNPEAIRQPRFQRREASLNADSWKKFCSFAQSHGLTPSMALCAAYSEILAAWSDSPHFTLNLTLFNRRPIHPEVSALVGDFTSVLLLEVGQDRHSQPSFAERARGVQSQLRADLEHRTMSGIEVLREINRNRRGNFTTMPVIFTSALGMSELDQHGTSGLGWLGKRVYGISQTPQVWLDHQVMENVAEGGIAFTWDAVEALFPAGMLDDMFAAYCDFVHRLADNGEAWTTAHPLTPESHLALYAQANDTAGPVPAGLLHSALQAQVPSKGHRPAVVTTQRTISYKELFRMANRIGAGLRTLGAKPNTLVAIVMEKGWEQVAAAYGVLTSGAAYLPIDANLPQERIRTLLSLGEVRIALTQASHDARIEWPEHVRHLTVEDEFFANQSPRKIDSIQKSQDLAYVIFTSGSTGVPKGVMIDHRGALNTVDDISTRFGVDHVTCALGVSALSFDLSVYDLFGVIGAGGTLVLPDANRLNDPEHWTSLITSHGVTFWNSAPALMDTLLEYLGTGAGAALDTLKTVLLSGDWIPLSVPKRLLANAPKADVISLGGATEASIWSIYYPVTEVHPEWRSIPYGKPLRNQQFHVLDEHLEPCPLWVPGSLYIGGIGLAKGYFRDRQKTRERFIRHPHTGEMLYRTGDLGRYLPDGNIEFLGREDFQLKVQGYRIEPGEIQAALSGHLGVRDSLVTAWTDSSGAKHLVAYVLPRLEIERALLRIPCVVDDASGNVCLMQAVDIAAHGTRITGASSDWTVGQALSLNMHLPGCAAPYDFKGEVAWRDEGLVGVHFDKDQDSVQFLDMCMRHRTRNFHDVSFVSSFRYRTTDGRRQEFRAPFAQKAVLIAGDSEHEVEVVDFSSSGARLTLKSPVEVETVALRMLVPAAEDYILVRGTVVWRAGMEAGIRFETSHAEHALLEESVAHLVKAGGYWLNPDNLGQLRDHLARSLPSYMVPRHFMLLSDFPLTANGKIDRAALPPPELQSVDSIAPRNHVEAVLAEIWKEVLGTNEIGVRDNFFDLGGYSQLAVRLLLRVRERLHVDLPIRALFENPSIEQLARRIKPGDAPGETAAVAEPIPDEALYGEYGRRGIYRRIRVIRADKQYVRGSGVHLVYEEDGREHEVLDMVGGFGSTLLGHNHPELVRELRAIAAHGVPMHAQHTNNIEAGQLAKKISDAIGQYTGRRYVATLASTGTEANEAAIKHAKMEVRMRAEFAMRNEKNLLALLVHEVRRGKIALDERVYARAEKVIDRAIARDPAALAQAIIEYNAGVYVVEPLFVALTHAFHGMTSGSLSLTASPDFRAPFAWMGVRSVWIEHNADELKAIVNRETHSLVALEMGVDGMNISSRLWHSVGALFIEPSQGEGGIHVVDREFAQAARAIADRHGFPIIADEVQCGLGRTGTFCAAEALGLRADYYTFAKTLGGGLSKIAALMVDSERYQEDFGYFHGSTFAEDRPACRMALKTLEIMEQDEIPARCTRQGDRFREKLEALRAKYPDVIAEVRGLGLMLGIELAPLDRSASFLFRALTHGGMEILNYIIAGYLLNKQSIRIAPTKTRNTIRFLPSAYITAAEMDDVIAALDRVFNMIHCANPGRLMRYVVDPDYDDSTPITDWRGRHPAWSEVIPGDEPRVAHIGHPETAETLLMAEPSLAEIPVNLHETLLERLFPVSRPAVTQQLQVKTATGETVHLSVIGIPLTGPMFERMMQGSERDQLIERVDEAIELAREMGCTVVGFGGYTSIVTMNCTTVATTDMVLTSGNAFTTAMAVEGLKKVATSRGLEPAISTLGVVGARGNIGAVCARVLAKEWARIKLIGRAGSEEGLREVAYGLYAEAWDAIRTGKPQHGIAAAVAATQAIKRLMKVEQPGNEIGARIFAALDKELNGRAPITIHTEMDALRDCDAVLSATSASRPVIHAHHVSGRTKVICDAAAPADVDASVLKERPDVVVISGGLVRLPNAKGLQLLGSRLPPEHVYGCVAETALLGLIGYPTHFSFGVLDPEQVQFIADAARQHGFALGALKAHELYSSAALPAFGRY